MSNISISGLRKSYEAFEVIHGINLDIAAGEFVALVGPSGCGKSTLLRMIAGLETITSGDMYIGENRINDVKPKDRDIAMVFQSYALYPHMTVAQNMGFSLRLRKIPTEQRVARVKQAAEILGLEHLLERFPRELSGGQRQRVAMGRAIVRDPQVFLFDEPLSNLDAKLRVRTRGEIKTLHKRLGTTTVYVTHDQIEAMTMADRIVVMNAGHIEQVGSPLELYDRPNNLFVAGFLGSPAMNFVRGTYNPTSGVFTVDNNGPEFQIGADRWDHSGPAILGLRPEHMVIDPAAPAAQISLIEPTGSETHLIFNWAGQSMTAVLRERVENTADQTLTVGFDTSRVHLFNPETSNRLIECNE